MTKPYDRQKAVLYAQKWALGANPEFYHFGGIGGDCTNFISQCLLAGGSVMNFNQYYGWFYKSVDNRSPSWTSVELLQRFLLNNNTIGPFASVKPLEELEIGDLIQLKQYPDRFSHTLIITKIKNGKFFVCAHSNDVLNRPLQSYQFEELIGLHIEGSYI